MELHLKIIGILLILLALLHIPFPKYFKWSLELKTLSLINRQMMITHTFFIALTIFLMGLLCLTCSKALITTILGQKIALGFGIFWSVRLFFQFFVYSTKLWKGKLFETIMHILFSILWTYFAIIFLLIFFK
ncbi:hypothetical protein [Lacinutrix mariniflava]|uniref:hypothetical protein n=1 Tax=Lacinutrix mariniflava TaxID=342955 RepID=UPI0006E25CF7|nr:hypothetical protein [Lacinutrix mariniflava]